MVSIISSQLSCRSYVCCMLKLETLTEIRKIPKEKENLKILIRFSLRGLIRTNFVVCRLSHTFSDTFFFVEAIDSWKQLISIMAGLFFSIATFPIFGFSHFSQFRRNKKKPSRMSKNDKIFQICYDSGYFQHFVINVQTFWKKNGSLKFECGERRNDRRENRQLVQYQLTAPHSSPQQLGSIRNSIAFDAQRVNEKI